ncbi:MAG: sigma-70 family RNA polymerase sigma factor [Pleurocapsa sp. MO_192.B19]|nr:sigma-70 family RNA polymerase sigma factor [Pleurocapsa sp. MO_192.B19]
MTQKLTQEALITLVTKAQNSDCAERTCQADRLAFSQIVRQFQDLAVGYAYSILRNFPLAEEAAQEAFIEAYLNLDRLLNPAAFPGWLKKIVLKHCNRITRKKRPPFVSLTQTGELISSQLNPMSIAEAREVKDQIQQAIELLPKAEREVVTLFYLGDRSQKEISAFLEVPISTIKNRLYSARKRLKPELNIMVEDYLSDRRPSQDDTFANRVIQIVKAACSGDEETIQTLLKQNANLAKAKDDYIHTTALHCAAHRGYLNIVKLLLLAGTDVNSQEGNYSQSTPLHWAATGGHLEVTQLLVDSGANVSAEDNWFNLTPIGWATIMQICPPDHSLGDRHQEIREYLISQGAQLDIFSAIAIDDGDQISSLIKSNREVLNQRLGFALDELQPLHYAIQEDKIEIAQLLIEQGANLQAQTRFGVTPLCMAIQVGNSASPRNYPR